MVQWIEKMRPCAEALPIVLFENHSQVGASLLLLKLKDVYLNIFNSSPVGKFVEIHFDKSGRIYGAAIRTYHLESSRVCQISDPERNCNCFYLLCAAPSEETEKYKLETPKSFHYLYQSNCFELEGVDDAEEYIALRRAMDIVGINDHEQFLPGGNFQGCSCNSSSW